MRKLFLLSAAAAWMGSATTALAQTDLATAPAFAEGHITGGTSTTIKVTPSAAPGTGEVLVAVISTSSSRGVQVDSTTEALGLSSSRAVATWEAGEKGEKTFTGLTAGVQYHVHFQLHDAGRRTYPGDVSTPLAVRTAPAAPTAPTLDWVKTTSVRFKYATPADVPANTTHVYFASTTDIMNAVGGNKGFDKHTGTMLNTGAFATFSVAAGTRENDVVFGETSPSGNKALTANTQYYFYMLRIGTGNVALRSSLVSLGQYYTAPAVSDAPLPTLTADKGKTTHEKMVLDVSAIPASYTRAYYVSATTLDGIDGGDDYFDGAGGSVTTGTVAGAKAAGEVSIFAGAAATDKIVFTVAANTMYYVRARDYRTGETTASTKLSANAAFWTAPAMPTGYTAGTKTATSVAFSGGNDVPDGVTRRFFAFPDGATAPTMAQAMDDQGVALKVTAVMGTSATGEGTTVTFAGLEASTDYDFYFLDYNATSGLASAHLKVDAMTAAGTPDKPVYTVDASEATVSAIKLESTAAVPAGATRHFFYSTATIPASVSVDAAGSAKTFAKAAGTAGSFLLGNGTNKASTDGDLEANTKYYVRVYDVRNSMKSETSDEVTGWTKPATPSGYTAANATPTGSSVTFTGGTAKPGNVTRRYYASTSATLALTATGTPQDATGVASTGTSSDDGVAVAFTGLEPETAYHFYFVDHNATSTLTSAHLKVGPVSTGAAAAATLAVTGVTDTEAVVTTTYTNAQDGDKLHWVLTQGEVDSDLTALQIKTAAAANAPATDKLAGQKYQGEQTTAGALKAGMPAADGKITGLEALTRYVLYAVYEVTAGDNVGVEKLTPEVIITAEPEAGVPTLTLTLHRAGGTDAVFAHATSAGDGSVRPYFFVEEADEVPTGDDLPDADDVKSADGEVHDADDDTVAGAEVGVDEDSGLVVVEGLESGTSYVVYAVLETNTTGVDDQEFSAVTALKFSTLQGGTDGFDVPFDGAWDPVLTATDVAATADFRKVTTADDGTTTRTARDLPDNASVLWVVSAVGTATSPDGELTPEHIDVANGAEGDAREGLTAVAKGKVEAAADSDNELGEVSVSGLTHNTNYYFYYAYKTTDENDDGTADDTAYGPVSALSFRTLWSKPTLTPKTGEKDLTHNSAKVTVATGVPSGTKVLAFFFVKEGDHSAEAQGPFESGLKRGAPASALALATPASTALAIKNSKETLKGLPGHVESDAVAAATIEASLTGLKKKTKYTMYAAFVTENGNYSLVAMKSFTTKDEPKKTWDPKIWGLTDASDVVYPNPTSGVLYVPVSDGHVQVYGTDGSSVGSLAVEEGLVDLSALPAGVYLLKVSGQTVRVVKN